MKVTRAIHTEATIVTGPASQLVPDMKMQSKDGGEEGFILGFINPTPDGQEIHYYVLDSAGKEAIVKQLTGGIIPAGAEALRGLPSMAVPRGRKH